jgi:hypothetical protein
VEKANYSKAKMNMDYNEKQYSKFVIDHYRQDWKGQFQIHQWHEGPMISLDPEFCILEFKPDSKREMWTYATCGMSTFEDNDPIELHLFSSQQDNSLIELLTVVGYYHKIDRKLGLNHTINFGRPWQPESICSYGLVSLPYLDGPALETFNTDRLSIHFYWPLPITLNELNYKKRYGVELLEEEFDKNKLNYIDATRKSVV